MKMNVGAETSEEVCNLLQLYQLPVESLRQWQRAAVEAAQEERLISAEDDSEMNDDADAAYVPSSLSSTASFQRSMAATLRMTRSHASTQKRPHSITPIEGEPIRLLMRAIRTALKEKDDLAPMQDVVSLEQTQEQSVTRDAWPELWQILGSTWPITAKTAFPRDTSSAAQWSEAAKGEPVRLMRLLHQFPYPNELLAAIDEPVLESWTMDRHMASGMHARPIGGLPE